jgi:hypothetical protein
MLRELNVVSDISGRARNGEARPHPYPLPREREWRTPVALLAAGGEDRAQSNCLSQERGRNTGLKL